MRFNFGKINAGNLLVPGTVGFGQGLFVTWVYAQEELRDVKAPIGFPGMPFWVIVLGVLCVVALGGFLYLRKRKNGI